MNDGLYEAEIAFGQNSLKPLERYKTLRQQRHATITWHEEIEHQHTA